ncbi:SelB domain-containing protein [Leucobacter salsicius]|uniref:SelB domain-containing protein n=1 Tax=Leucobacter salsicius TaxID=664638 RepID=UPI00034CE7BC|nr:SelB C-terminal domain-containing protein [Leucobacter salsicius]
MYVVATAGHVDHGKSTLVRALTGMEPDRLAEEQRRGLTIDLGFAWTGLPSGRGVAFVDVPGHERFLSNMLAGVGPAPVVLFVVAADKGWQAQSTDHRDAIAALGISRAVIAITRADRAPDNISEITAAIRSEFAGTALAEAPIIPVAIPSGGETTGLAELVAQLDRVLAEAPAPDAAARVRLWVDRSFTIKGSGTVVTGTLTAGTLRHGDALVALGGSGSTPTAVREIHSQNSATEAVTPTSRVAVNLRDVHADAIGRGDALVTPEAWCIVSQVDVRRTTGRGLRDAPQEFTAHIGTAAVTVRLRPFDDDHGRLSFARSLPLQVGDRIVLRASGSHEVFAGVTVLDVDVPALTRRGDGRRRGAALALLPETGDAFVEVARRGAMRPSQLRTLGVGGLEQVPDGLVEVRLRGGAAGGGGSGGGVASEVWWVLPSAIDRWAKALRSALSAKRRADPLAAGLAHGAAIDALKRRSPALPDPAMPDAAMPDPALLPLVVHRAGLESAQGVLREPNARVELGAAEVGVAALERRLRDRPFAAPEADDLVALHLGTKEIATAERAGRLIRLRDGVVLLPQAPALAMRRLSALAQPFTTSEARQALDTTRRVAIPLLEHLDAKGWTRRLDGTRREIAR